MKNQRQRVATSRQASRLTVELDNGTDASRWAPLIGEFMICFGLMEANVNDLLAQSATPAVSEFSLPLPLNQRILLLRRLTGERKLSKANREAILANLDELQDLATYRNLIAHSPLSLDANKAGASAFDDNERILSGKSSKKLAFGELSDLTDRAVRLAVVLQQNCIEFDVARLKRGLAMMKGERIHKRVRLLRAVPA